jgi:hypothetical protein
MGFVGIVRRSNKELSFKKPEHVRAATLVND